MTTKFTALSRHFLDFWESAKSLLMRRQALTDKNTSCIPNPPTPTSNPQPPNAPALDESTRDAAAAAMAAEGEGQPGGEVRAYKEVT
jgi:hypothetical protein